MKTTCRVTTHLYLMKSAIVFLTVFSTHWSFAQVNDNPKLSPGLLNEIKTKKIKEKLLLEITIENNKIPAEILKPVYQAQKIFESPTFSVYRLLASPEELNSVL